MSLATAAMLVFGGLGATLYGLGWALFPPRVDLAVSVSRYDAAQRTRPGRTRDAGDTAAGRGWAAARQRRLGAWLGHELGARGLPTGTRLTDLDLLGRDPDAFLGRKVLIGAYGALLLPAAAGVTALSGARLPLLSSPVVLIGGSTALGAAFLALPDLDIRRQAAARRRDFTRALGASLDLVAMSLAGGRGVPEALPTAARVGEGWAFAALADIASARLAGQTPWEALGELGERIGVPELADLAGALTLVAADGARVRESITARAATLRRRQLADAEGKAGEADQGMLVAQVVLAFGFLLLLMYPAAYNVITF